MWLILYIVDTIHQNLTYDLIKFFVMFECSLLLTAVEVAFCQLDDGVIFVQHSTPVYSLSMAGLQYLHSEGVWTLGHLEFASIHYVCTLAECKAMAAVSGTLPAPHPQQALMLSFIGTCQRLPVNRLTGSCTQPCRMKY